MRESSLALVVLAAASPTFAQEHVLFEVQGKESLSGTIRPRDEREAILCRMARGSVLKATAKSIDKAGPVPVFELLDGGGVAVPGVSTSPKGRGTLLSPIAAPATDLYKLVVRGDGQLDGDYQVTLSWKPQKAFSGTGTSNGETTFQFAAPPQATVAITLAAAKGSPFVPNLVSLDGPGAADVVLAGGGKAKGIALTASGDWSVKFASGGPEGAYTISVKIAAPAPKKHTFDIRDGSLAGAFGDGNTVVGAVIDPTFGGSVDVTNTGSPIDGSSVSVPPDSLGQTTSIFVAQTTPYTPPGGDVPAGPAVEFGPSGTQFDPAKPATVTIPFDAEDFPGGTGVLVVYVKNADGTIEPVLPTSSYVFGPGTVSFTTSHFSAFQAATRGNRGPLVGDYEMIEIFGSPSFRAGGYEGVGAGTAFFNANRNDFLTDRAMVHWEAGNVDIPEPTVILDEQADDVLLTSTQLGDSTFDLVDVNNGSPMGRVRRGVNDDVLTIEHVSGLRLGTALLVRRVESRPTMNSLAGRWHVIVWEIAANAAAAGDTTLPIFLIAETGGLVIDPDGTATFKMTGGVKRFSDFPGGDWNSETLKKRQAVGRLQIDPDSIPVLDFGMGEEFVGFKIGAGGEVLVGKMRNFDRGFGAFGVETGLMILVRESTGAAPGDLEGTFSEVLGGLDLDASADSGMKWRANSGTDTFAADATFTGSFLECLSGYPNDGGSEPQMSQSQIDLGAPVKFGISPTGVFTVPAFSIQGAARTGRGLVIYLIRDPRALGLGFKLRVAPTRT